MKRSLVRVIFVGGLVLLVCRIALRLARVCLRQDDASLLDRDETAGEAP